MNTSRFAAPTTILLALTVFAAAGFYTSLATTAIDNVIVVTMAVAGLLCLLAAHVLRTGRRNYLAKVALEREHTINELRVMLEEAHALLPKIGKEPYWLDDRNRAATVAAIYGIAGLYNIPLEELGTTNEKLDDLARPRSRDLIEDNET